jgi:hypothetical protein
MGAHSGTDVTVRLRHGAVDADDPIVASQARLFSRRARRGAIDEYHARNLGFPSTSIPITHNAVANPYTVSGPASVTRMRRPHPAAAKLASAGSPNGRDRIADAQR